MKNKLYTLTAISFLALNFAKAQQLCGSGPMVNSVSSCNQATVYWTPNSNAILYEYKLDSANVTVAQGSNTATNVMLSGLTQSTLYIASVRSICPSDTSNWVAHTFITPACVQCPTPGALTAMVVGCDSVYFGWNAPPPPQGFQDYQYSVTLDPMQPNWVTVAPPQPLSGAFGSAGGLLPDTVYHILVRTNCVTNGYSNLRTLIVTTPPCPTAIKTTLTKKITTLYPNPVTTTLTLNLNNVNDKCVIELMGTDGKVIYRSVPKLNTHTIDMSELANGIYFVRYSDGVEVQYARVLKQ